MTRPFWTPRALRAMTILSIAMVFISPAWSAGSAEIDQAIDAGRDFLLDAVQKRPFGEKGIGQLALETYALIVSGVSVDHPVIREALKNLKDRGYAQGNSYNVACTIFAFGAAIEQVENDFLLVATPKAREKFQADRTSVAREFRAALAQGVGVLVDAQNARGGWRYHTKPRDEDMSCIQFAILGLGVGAKHRVNIPEATWRRAFDYIITNQDAHGEKTDKRVTLGKLGPRDGGLEFEPEEEADGDEDDVPDADNDEGTDGKDKKSGGKTNVPETPEVDPDPVLPTGAPEDVEVLRRGWGYVPARGASWNMTCAGVSSMMLAREHHAGITPDQESQARKSIRDGIGWLLEKWEPKKSYYGMYSLEKVADLGGIRLFDTHDWYEVLSDHLVGTQTDDGSWPKGSGHAENPRVATAFALLILRRATVSVSTMVKETSERVIVYGKDAGQQVTLDRNWVYVPDIDSCVHLPSILEILRDRPHPKLTKLARSVISVYPPEYSPELIPLLLRFRGQAPTRKLRSMADSSLKDLVGKKLKSDGEYESYHASFQEALELDRANEESPEVAARLKAIFEAHPHSLAHKQCAVRYYQRHRDLGLVLLLVDDLEHSELEHRRVAYLALTGFFFEPLPNYDAGISQGKRRKQVKHVRQFVEKRL